MEHSIEEKVKDWNSWLGHNPNDEATIYSELTNLTQIRHVFKGVAEMVETNDQLQQRSLFHDVFALNYAHSVLMYIRRQVDPKGNSQTALLNDILKNHTLVTRDWYIATYTHGKEGELYAVAEQNAISTFDRHFGGAGCNHGLLDKNLLQTHINELKDIRQSIKMFVNWRVAHVVLKETKKVPTYPAIDSWVQTLERFFKHYLLLLQGAHLETLMPTLVHDWKAIFTVPWIPSPEM